MYYIVIKDSGHLRTLKKCRKHSPSARVFYMSFVFSNARRVLSQCNTLLTVKYHDDLRNLFLFEKIIERDRPLMKFDHVKSYFFFSAMLIHISID